MASAADFWSDALASWAIPPRILERAPESPWHFPPELFTAIAQHSLADPVGPPSRRLALETLPDGGTVLDVGAGGGAASLPLAPPAALLTAVDESAEMLDRFAAGAEARGVAHREVHGQWPGVAPMVDVADVVVCHHVFYNVADLVHFAEELTRHAKHRVVVEMTAVHPQSTLNRLWKELHGVDRPTSPTASDAVAVLAEMGLDVATEEYEREPLWGVSAHDHMVAFTRRRLCVGPERDHEIEALLSAADDGPLRQAVALWWPGSAAEALQLSR